MSTVNLNEWLTVLHCCMAPSIAINLLWAESIARIIRCNYLLRRSFVLPCEMKVFSTVKKTKKWNHLQNSSRFLVIFYPFSYIFSFCNSIRHNIRSFTYFIVDNNKKVFFLSPNAFLSNLCISWQSTVWTLACKYFVEYEIYFSVWYQISLRNNQRTIECMICLKFTVQCLHTFRVN